MLFPSFETENSSNNGKWSELLAGKIFLVMYVNVIGYERMIDRNAEEEEEDLFANYELEDWDFLRNKAKRAPRLVKDAANISIRV